MGFLRNIPLFRDFLLPILDITLLAYLLYRLYVLLEETRAIQLLRGAVILAFVYAVAALLPLPTLLWMLRLIAPGLFIGVAIVFQPELRKIVSQLGQGELFNGKKRKQPYHVNITLNAAGLLSNHRRGALIVFARKVGLKEIIDTGTLIDANLSSALILTIFGYDGPLHDGAIVVRGGRLIAAGCFLPLSNQTDIKKSFGTRHRAALGMAEETDALVLVVSEETGALSLAYGSNIFYDLEIEEIRRRLNQFWELGSAETNTRESS